MAIGFSRLGGGGTISIKMLGRKRLEKNLENYVKNLRSGSVKALDLVSLDVLQRAADLCPILYGFLIDTGQVIPILRSKKKATNVVSFGGQGSIPGNLIHEPPSAYVRFIHFGTYNLGPISKMKPATEDGPVGRMFLHRPFNRHRKRYAEFVLTFARRSGESGKLVGRRSTALT